MQKVFARRAPGALKLLIFNKLELRKAAVRQRRLRDRTGISAELSLARGYRKGKSGVSGPKPPVD
jgi:hypothetical protein